MSASQTAHGQPPKRGPHTSTSTQTSRAHKLLPSGWLQGLQRASKNFSLSQCRHSKVELSLSSVRCHRPSRRIMSSSSKPEPFSIGAVLHGRSGRKYGIQEILSEHRDPLLCVYRARCVLWTRTCDVDQRLTYASSSDAENFVVKNMIPGEFEYQQDLQSSLASYPNLRTAIDTIPDFELLVYRFLAGDLLQISQKALTKATRKSILKSALSGLAALHEKGIIHTGKLDSL